MLELTAETALYILGVIGFLAFLVEVIVQLTKELPGIVKLPTKLWAIVVSLIICLLLTIIFVAWKSISMMWYYIALAILAAFVVAYISIFGWETTKELYERFRSVDKLS